MAQSKSRLPRVLFMYLGRHGALGAFTAELAAVAPGCPSIDPYFLLSSNNALTGGDHFGAAKVHTLETFATPTPWALGFGFLRARRRIVQILDEVRPDVVVNLMPHVWTPLLAPLIRRKGARFVTLIHDAAPHPGDPTARLTRWLLRDIRHADLVLTLSESVRQTIVEAGHSPAAKVQALFHPDLRFSDTGSAGPRRPRAPFRILFFGRIMAYKGLDILVDAVGALRAHDIDIRLGVAGSGSIPAEVRAKLASLDAEVINRWIGDDEITGLFERYDAVACPHVEASQSGVAAAAFGHGLPVVAMPVGGVIEQVIDGKTGVVAGAPTAESFAVALKRLALDPELYDAIVSHIRASRDSRSMDRFLRVVAVETGAILVAA